MFGTKQFFFGTRMAWEEDTTWRYLRVIRKALSILWMFVLEIGRKSAKSSVHEYPFSVQLIWSQTASRARGALTLIFVQFKTSQNKETTTYLISLKVLQQRSAALKIGSKKAAVRRAILGYPLAPLEKFGVNKPHISRRLQSTHPAFHSLPSSTINLFILENQMMASLKSIYQSFLANPDPSALSDDASLSYITTLTTINTATAIIKHHIAHRKTLTKKEEKVLSYIESSDAVCLDIETTLEFLTGGGAYLPGLDDNFLADRVVTFPMVSLCSVVGRWNLLLNTPS